MQTTERKVSGRGGRGSIPTLQDEMGGATSGKAAVLVLSWGNLLEGCKSQGGTLSNGKLFLLLEPGAASEKT